MAAAGKAVIGILILTLCCSAQHLGTRPSRYPAGICPSMHCNIGAYSLRKLKECVVVLGNLKIVLMEKTGASEFRNITFPNLREVTGYVILYRVPGLESVGQLLPNLTRIRGTQLLDNYALVVNDMPNLKNVGLSSLLKIDRGGVFISGGRHTCYVTTVDWDAIAPRSSHVLNSEVKTECHTALPCQCGGDGNHCWKSKSCQRFVTGPQAQSCHPECLGCSSDPNTCSVCRHYTHKGRCVTQCPDNTIVLPENQYCITTDECKSLGGWAWNETCVFDCPVDHERIQHNDTITCQQCISCQKVCNSMDIHSLNGIQLADRCVVIAGTLKIRLKPTPGVIDELKKYLHRIETITDYLHIYSSIDITSLEFLPSLRHIAGRRLIDNHYSVVIQDNNNLRQLFSPAVMKDVIIDRGKLKVLNNPQLCMNYINDLEAKFPIKSNETDIPPGSNGYSGGCEDYIRLDVEIINETAVNVVFTPKNYSNYQYTVLYARVSSENHIPIVPEACTDSDWSGVHASDGSVTLTSLLPGANYAVCVETFVYYKNPLQTYIARTTVQNFTMPFKKPEPPFIQELKAFSPNTAGLRWVDHKDFRQHITRYELDISLVEISEKDVTLRDHCRLDHILEKEDYSRHVVVLKPPVEYEACDSECTLLIPLPDRLSIIEDSFDICSVLESRCDDFVETRPKNSSYLNYVRTQSLDIHAPKKIFHVENLAPFRSYRFSLRACSGNKCSRSAREVIQTLKSKKADIPLITYCNYNTTHIHTEWSSPEETNGPIFAYTLQVLINRSSENLPYSWCVGSEVRSLIASLDAKKFQVRVCSSTLGSLSACSDWRLVTLDHDVDYSFVPAAVILSISLVFVSVAIGFVYHRQRRRADTVPLVEMTSMFRSESAPPADMLEDFTPLYLVPSNEALFC